MTIHKDMPNRGVPTSFEDQYKTIQSGAGCFFNHCGIIRMDGPDCIDLLNRMSTNFLSDMQFEDVRYTVLTNAKAKIVDLIIVLQRTDHVLLITSHGNSVNVKEWLEKFIIMEKIKIKDVTDESSTAMIIGAEGKDFIQKVLGAPIPEGNKASYSSSHKNLIVFEDSLWTIPVYQIIYCNRILEDILDKFDDVVPISHEMFSTLRIEHGIPEFGKEISENVNPLEAGLGDFVSFTKGCYIGQEVIARIDSYKKLQKSLHGFIFDAIKEHRSMEGCKVFNGNDEIAQITSDTWSISLRKWIAMGYLRTNRHATTVSVILPDLQEKVVGNISQLPFIS